MSRPQIQSIIEGSIQVKQALLNDEQLMLEIEKIVHAITMLLNKGMQSILQAMVEAQQMHNIWQQNFLVVFTRTEKHFLRTPYIAIVLI